MQQPLSTILFVDDEPRVLEGLQGRLRKQRHRWAMEFVCGGERAMELIAERPFDVVVTDLRMPRVDGLAILRHLQASHPGTMRIVLSGEPERAQALECAPYAHQSLTKPSRPDELEAMLERAIALRELVVDPDVRRALGRIRELPVLPRTYVRLSTVLADDNSSLAEIADVIAADIAVSAKLLKLSNSAFFGIGRAVTSASQAIQLLGTEAVRMLVLTSSLFDASKLTAPQRAFAESLQQHSLLVASLAATIAGEARRDAFAAAILHDVGRMVLALEMPDAASAPTDVEPTGAGSDDEPFSHAKVGAYLLGLWGLPIVVFDSVARHHLEPAAGAPLAAAAVYWAERVVHEVSGEALPTADQLAAMQAVARDHRGALAELAGARASHVGPAPRAAADAGHRPSPSCQEKTP
jgi:putative nucleotidyltransferase with HDIG domain